MSLKTITGTHEAILRCAKDKDNLLNIDFRNFIQITFLIMIPLLLLLFINLDYSFQIQSSVKYYEYRPEVGGSWMNWNRPRKGFATQVQFPGPVNNTTVASITTTSTTTMSSKENNNNCSCGVIKASLPLQRITGGSISKENAWPWMAAIIYMGTKSFPNPFWFCGASLINDRYLLTASHCMKTIKRKGISNIRILLGSNGIPEKDSPDLYEISEIKMHPLYKPNTEDYDIGLLKLKRKIEFSDKISPICLTQRGSPFVDRMAIVAGWGSIQHGDSPPDELREVEIKVTTTETCQREYMYNYGTRITPSMLCAWLPGKDSCQGDSGGPIFLKTTSEPKVYTQIGVVSFGPPQCGETKIPGVYSRVYSSLRWIKANTRDGTYCGASF